MLAAWISYPVRCALSSADAPSDSSLSPAASRKSPSPHDGSKMASSEVRMAQSETKQARAAGVKNAPRLLRAARGSNDMSLIAERLTDLSSLLWCVCFDDSSLDARFALFSKRDFQPSSAVRALCS